MKMFDKLRRPNKERSYKKIFATVLFGIICFSFVFLGLTPDGSNSFDSAGAAAYVNGNAISIADFRERLDYNERQRGQGINALPAAERNAKSKELRMRTIEELIDLEVNVQAAKKNGIVAPDSAVRDQIVNIPAFQNEGQFDRTRYDQYLEFTRSSPGEFENKVRAQVIDSQIRQAFFRALKNPDDLGAAEEQMRETKLNIEFIKFKKEELKVTGETKPDDVLKSLEDSLKDGKAVDSQIAAQGWKWQETGSVDLSSGSVLPNLGDQPGVLEAAVDLREPGKIAPKVVRSGADMFLVRLKSLSMPNVSATPAKKKNNFSIAPFEALNSWSRAAKEKSSVKRNDALL